MASQQANLTNATALLVDSDHFTRGIIAQMLRGFGLEAPVLLGTGKEAQDFLLHNYVDICIIEAMLPDMMGTDLVTWIRRREASQIRFVPIIVLTGYTQFNLVSEARDAGASLVVKKPVSAQMLWDRIVWAGRSNRAFIETADYVGPDRRFRSLGPPNGIGRRETDRSPAQPVEQAGEDHEEPNRKKAAV